MNKTVWKVGCRWSDYGNPDTTIADSVFFKKCVAFANTHAMLDARAGHLIALADGYNVIAIGEIVSAPKRIEELGIIFTDEAERKQFFNDEMLPYEANDNASNVCGCIVHYYRLEKNECFQYCKRGRFFHATGIEKHVNELFDKIIQDQR